MADKFKPSTTIDPATFNAITLDDISQTLRKVLNELTDERDEGKEYYYEGAATQAFYVLDLEKNPPYHAVKGYTLINDGANDIEVTHNNTVNAPYPLIKSNESHPVSFNRNTITKIFLRTKTGTASYRLFLTW